MTFVMLIVALVVGTCRQGHPMSALSGWLGLRTCQLQVPPQPHLTIGRHDIDRGDVVGGIAPGARLSDRPRPRRQPSNRHTTWSLPAERGRTGVWVVATGKPIPEGSVRALRLWAPTRAGRFSTAIISGSAASSSREPSAPHGS
jgi:hypothetical protein